MATALTMGEWAAALLDKSSLSVDEIIDRSQHIFISERRSWFRKKYYITIDPPNSMFAKDFKVFSKLEDAVAYVTSQKRARIDLGFGIISWKKTNTNGSI